MRISLTEEETEYLEEVLDQLCWDQQNGDPPHDFELEKLEPLIKKVRKALEAL